MRRTGRAPYRRRRRELGALRGDDALELAQLLAHRLARGLDLPDRLAGVDVLTGPRRGGSPPRVLDVVGLGRPAGQDARGSFVVMGHSALLVSPLRIPASPPGAATATAARQKRPRRQPL